MPGLFDFITWQGDEFVRAVYATVGGERYPLAGCGVRMQIRHWFDIDPPILSLDLTHGLAVDLTANVITITIDAVETAALPPTDTSPWVYDLEIVPDADETKAFKWLAGKFWVNREATT